MFSITASFFLPSYYCVSSAFSRFSSSLAGLHVPSSHVAVRGGPKILMRSLKLSSLSTAAFAFSYAWFRCSQRWDATLIMPFRTYVEENSEATFSAVLRPFLLVLKLLHLSRTTTFAHVNIFLNVEPLAFAIAASYFNRVVFQSDRTEKLPEFREAARISRSRQPTRPPRRRPPARAAA